MSRSFETMSRQIENRNRSADSIRGLSVNLTRKIPEWKFSCTTVAVKLTGACLWLRIACHLS